MDLTRTHYTLGSSNEKLTTTSQDYKPCIGERAPIIMTSEFSKGTHFIFGTDKPGKTSIASSDYVSKKFFNIDKNEVAEITKGLQKAHFKIGNDMPNYMTTTSSEFYMKTSRPLRSNFGLQKEHFLLGTDRPNYLSMSHKNYSNKFHEKEGLNLEQLNDLRKTHFNLGNTGGGYGLTSQDFRPHMVENDNQSRIRDGLLRKTNFVMGNHNKQTSSSYKLSHSNSVTSFAVKTRDRNTDKLSHFKLGNDFTPSETLHRQDFKEHKIEGSNDIHQAEYLRGHHYILGTEKANFKSMNQRYGDRKPQPNEKNIKTTVDLRKSHFLMGSDPLDMQTISQKDFKGNKPSHIASAEKVHGKHSYKDGNGKNLWNTEQRSRFKWINPVEETEFKLSFD
ncbi:hypothetical protein SteCoe_23478 [Stentor coeruleus]|uniref:Uncharacterized protein n=1 Tax=Stentor coeruleus TaxID=5963 RepID=A0A1R2BK95_9CILI|nr:hypothetical protein SteCoe_23478 [Stentor coeruleus]